MLMQAEYPSERIVWVDADAEIQQYPEMFWNMPADVDMACHWRDGKELLSGTLYFGATKGAAEIVEKWCEAQKLNTGVWDQRTLQGVMMGAYDRWNTVKLPPSYAFIFDTFRKKYPGVEPVIEHHQASRRKR